MKYFIVAALLFTGCGIKVEGPEDVRVIHEVSVDSILPYISAYCELGNSTPADIQACVNVEIGKLLGKL